MHPRELLARERAGIATELAEKGIQQITSGRCPRCSGISFASFRTRNPLKEMLSKRTFILGDMRTVVESSYAGCLICRLVAREIAQRLSTEDQIVGVFYRIRKVGLRLSLDDELTLHCWLGDGSPLQLNDLEAEPIQLRDALWNIDGSPMMGKKMPDSLSFMSREEVRLRNFLLVDPELPDDIIHDMRLQPNPRREDKQHLTPYWLRTCAKNHQQCRVAGHVWMEAPTLPTRVLDVSDENTVRVFHTNGQKGHYVALSHCWGQGGQKLILTKDNLEEMTAGFPQDKLPRTFWDAAMMTAAIRFKYLWIDSLCIIQPTEGDLDDWDREVAKMGEYYSNSTLTIAATAAVNNTKGCLPGRPLEYFDVRPVPLFRDPIQREWSEFDQAMGRNTQWLPIMQPKPASFLQQTQNSPLNSRAWVFQERILAPRILHCTLQGLMWECNETRATEFEPNGCAFDYHVRDRGFGAISDDDATGAWWRKAIEHFSQLGITVPSDRLPAVAGLARVISEKAGDGYTAGHWTSTLISSLLWFRVSSQVRPTRLPNAPTWSWASSTGAVKFTSLDVSDYPSRNKEEYTLTADLVKIDSSPVGANKYSWLRSSSLHVRARLVEQSKHDKFPEMSICERTSEDIWLGHRPVQEAIHQMGTIQMPNSRQGDEDGVSGEEGDEASWLTVATSHTAMQETIRETMESIQQSDTWKRLDAENVSVRETQRAQDEETAPRGGQIRAILDIPDDPLPSDATLALIEVIRSEQGAWEEGLILCAEQDGWRRVGFFTTEGQGGRCADLFECVEKVDVKLL